MASGSPIVLNSSSQASFRIPSVTPQSHRKASNVATSSSPGLEDLPSFKNVPAKGLKSGSNAQQLPEGASFGFASAASLWKRDKDNSAIEREQQQYEVQLADHHVKDKKRKSEKSTGKLSKPKKTKPAPDTKQRSVESGKAVLENAGHASGSEHVKTRTPSISLSDYDFRPEEHQGSPSSKALSLKSAKKIRPKTRRESQAEKVDGPNRPIAKAAKAVGAGREPASRKPKKRFAKSESIILNSDEPDPVVNIDVSAATGPSLARQPDRVAIEKETSEPRRRERSLSSRFDYTVQKEVEAIHDAPSIETTGKSLYFTEEIKAAHGTDANVATADNDAMAPRSILPMTATASPAPLPAPRRRLSWTPLRDTSRPATTSGERPGTASSTGSVVRVKSLASLVSAFGYSEKSASDTASNWTPTGEAFTKRRRIKLADASTVGPAKRNPAKPVIPETAKKPKAKKKPQTITGLATKAYRLETDTPPAGATISEFFPTEQPSEALTADKTLEQGRAEKPKKPRKPRSKKLEESVSAQKPRKAAKSKTKIKSKEGDYLAKLHAPDEARAQEQGQDFVFGTSSQLAIEESPTFIREMQAAIRESEPMPRYQLGRIRVSSAADRMSISVNQGKRDHWASAARSEAEDFLDIDTSLVVAQWSGNSDKPGTYAEQELPLAEAADPIDVGTAGPVKAIPQEADHADEADPLDQAKSSDGSRNSILETNGLDGNDPIDLCQSSPANHANHAPGANACNHLPHVSDQPPMIPGEVMDPSPEHRGHDDVWAILSSDDSYHGQVDANASAMGIPPRSPMISAASRPPQLGRSATSPTFSRTALQSLDANIGVFSHTSPSKGFDFIQQRALTTTASLDQPKRPRGRPRKNAALTSPSVSSPKRRGRPPKASPGVEALATSPRVRKRKAARAGLSASQPIESTDWMNIDEISDSDSPTTPSPPRQRAGSPLPAIVPLDVAISGSPSLSLKAPAAATSTLKANDPSFASIQGELFPKITAIVKSTPPSTDMQNPTWHEKILLYDPIVLEDLTAWLSEQGLRIEMRRLKPKAKTKGRKKKDAPPEEPEYEVVKEELKPWMVQKWCEEKSICCLWKEGLRGGVRTRY